MSKHVADPEELYRALGYTGDTAGIPQNGKARRSRRGSRAVQAGASGSEPPLLDLAGAEALVRELEKNPDRVVKGARRFMPAAEISPAELQAAIREAHGALSNPRAAVRKLERRGLFGRTPLPPDFNFPLMDTASLPINPDETKFETRADVIAWIIMCGPQFLETTVRKLDRKKFRFHDDARFTSTDFVYQANEKVPLKIGLFSDFGTGVYQSGYIARKLVEAAYPYAFHLGDVYYAGRKSEFFSSFQPQLDPLLATTRLFTIPGNHEMYSKGVPFYEYIDERRRRFPGFQEQEGSYCCVEFDDFRIVAVDTAYLKGGRHDDPKLVDWLRARLIRDGKRNILLSSDHPFDYGSEDTTKLMDDMAQFANAGLIDLWFWGNTHYCALYDRADAVPFIGSCIGHGGYPYTKVGRDKPAPSKVRFLETFPRFPNWTSLRQDRGNNGYCEMTLNAGGAIDLRYVDWMGYERCLARLSGDPLRVVEVREEMVDTRGKEPRGTQRRTAAAAMVPLREEPQSVAGKAVPVAGTTALAGPALVLDRSRNQRDDTFCISILDSAFESPYAQILATFRNATVLDRFDKSGGIAGKRWHDIIETNKHIRDYVNGVPEAPELPTGKALLEFGQLLFETLFTPRVLRLYDVARAMKEGERLDVVLTSTIDWMADKPWEFAFDPTRKIHLATQEVNFVRNVQTAIPTQSLDKNLPHLRILVVAAQPIGVGELSIEEETEVVRDGFRALIDANLATVDVLLSATPARLHRMLQTQEPFDVIHVIGHGEFDRERGMGYLIFENENGGVQELDALTLKQIVCQRGVQVVFLNACETGSGGASEFRGVAQELVSGGVPAVIANQFSVLDSSATAFARHFYWSLAHGNSIGDSAREARVAVNYAISGEAIDWAIPIVFSRNPSDRLCAPRAASRESFLGGTAQTLQTRRSRGAARRLIALWDPHRTIPNLHGIAEQLTAAQNCFQFEDVHFPAPLGTWTRDRTEGTTYLHADRMASRLEKKPKELGLDQLICFTQFPLRDSETLNLFGWQSADARISIFSSYDLMRQLKPPDTTVERMIANQAAAFLSELPSHKSGPKNCPNFWNANRDVEYIAGRLRFCVPCIRKQQKKVSQNMVACLTALLEL